MSKLTLPGDPFFPRRIDTQGIPYLDDQFNSFFELTHRIRQQVMTFSHCDLRKFCAWGRRNSSPIFKCLSAYQDSQDNILQDEFLALYASLCLSYRVEAKHLTFQQQHGRYRAGRLSCSRRVTPTWFVRNSEITRVQVLLLEGGLNTYKDGRRDAFRYNLHRIHSSLLNNQQEVYNDQLDQTLQTIISLK